MINLNQAFSDQHTLSIASFEIPPYITLNANQKPSGIFISTVEEAAIKAGINIEFNITNWPRAQALVKVGEADAIFPVIWTEERSVWLTYPEQPITQFAMTIFAHKEASVTFDGDFTSIHGKTIGKIAKAKMHPSFTELEQSGKIKTESFKSIDLMIKAVDNHRVSAFVTPLLMGQAQLKKFNSQNVIQVNTPVGISDIYLALSKQSSKEEQWKALLAEIHALPGMEERYQNYHQNKN